MTNKSKKSKLSNSRSNGSRPKARQSGGVQSTIVAPRAFVGTMGNNPRMRPSNGGVIITNTESFGSVDTNGAFTASRNALTPSAMPWLSRVAAAYSKYRWKRLRVFYLTQVSTTAEGRFAMGLTYDQLDALPTTLNQIISLNRAAFGPVWSGQGGFDATSPFQTKPGMVCLDVDTNRFAKPWYPYATTAQLAALPVDTYGSYVPTSLVSGTDGTKAGAAVVGSVYVSYEIELIEPSSNQ